MAPMTKIILIRHAETELAGRFCGHSDPDLNTAGEEQLASTVQQIASLGIQRILSSDLRRALRTAQAISQHIGAEVELRPGLREIHFGLWEGLSWAEIETRFPQEAQAWIEEFPMRSAPEGEPYMDFSRRIDNEFAPFLRSEADRVTAVITHRGVMRYALTRFFGYSEHEASELTASYGAVVPVMQQTLVEIHKPAGKPDTRVIRRANEHCNKTWRWRRNRSRRWYSDIES